MAFITTVDLRGVVTRRQVGGSDQFAIGQGTDFKTNDVQYAGAASANINSSVVVFEGSGANITGTLPAINPDNLGLDVHVVNANTTKTIMVTGSNRINNAPLGVGLTFSTSGKHLQAISSSTGFQWVSF
jgi:hypothetical protein